MTYEDKRWGMPWILDTKYLFYNKDMLAKAGIAAPPKTWAELSEQAKIIKDKGIVKFPIVWSWAQAEAIICDYGTLVDAYKGQFFQDGKPIFDQGGSLEAVNYMEQSLKDGLTNPNSREYLEEDVRKVFSNGDAAFALNWTYMYNLANDPKESKIAGQVGHRSGTGRGGQERGLGHQRLHGPGHHGQQHPCGRGVEIHLLHHLSARAEQIRQAQPSHLEELL